LNKWLSELSLKVSISSPPDLYPELKQVYAGRFLKAGCHLPFTGGDYVDMRLDTESTKMGEILAQECKTAENYHTLLAVSGAGKTRSIFDIAMHHGFFMMYMECKPPVDKTSSMLATDHNFMGLHDAIQNTFSKEWNTIDTIEAKRLIALEFTARILYLILLKSSFPNLTPQQYLLAQLNGGQKCITDIKDELRNENRPDLKVIFNQALSRLKVGYVFSLLHQDLMTCLAKICSLIVYRDFCRPEQSLFSQLTKQVPPASYSSPTSGMSIRTHAAC
jgi:hypothetical protein